MKSIGSKKGFIPVILVAVLALVIAVGGVGIGLAWRTNRFDKWLPPNIKEMFGRGEKPGEKPEAKPEEDLTKDWKTYRSEECGGFEFKYPANFFWEVSGFEPKVMTVGCDYARFSEECPYIPIEGLTLSREEAIEKGWVKIKRLTINNIPYCLQEFSEGAAGSTYVTYSYTTVKEKECCAVYLVLQYTNCGVFGSPEEEAYQKCEYENEVTKPETLNQVVSTFKFIE